MSNYEYANGTGLSVLSQQIFEHLTPLVESVKVFFLASYDRENPPKIGKYIENEDGNSIWATEDNSIFAMEPWSDTPPERLPGMYLWTYTEAIFKDGSVYNSDPVCMVTWDDIDNAVSGMTASLEAGLALKADKATTYTKTEVDTSLAAKSDKATTYTKSDVDAIVNTDDVTSEAANPVTIETDAAQYAKNTHLTLAPIQDLHGYDHPWAGGAGKNLLPMTVNGIKTNSQNPNISWNGNVGTLNGATITLHTDDGISVSKISISGTPTNTIYFCVGTFNLKSGVSYVLNGCPSNKPDNGVLYVSSQPSGFGSWVDGGSGATYNAAQDWNEIFFYIRIWANVAQNNDWYPMIRLSTESDATFAPYSNICPITGVDEVEVRATGFNQWDEEWELGGIGSVDGIPYPSNDSIRSKNFCACVGGQQYFVKGAVAIYWYDSNKTFISISYAGNNVQTPPTNAIYFKLSFYRAYGTTYNHDICINISDAEKNGTYEPYQGYTASLDLPTTIYGGTLNLETGELVCDYGMVDLGTLTNSGDTGWKYITDDGTPYFCVYLTGKRSGLNMICSVYETNQTTGTGLLADKKIGGSANDMRVYLRDSAYTDLSAFISAMSGVQLVYELATPITYQLTPQQLALFNGTNNISTNAKTVKVTYRNGEFATTGDIVASTEVAKQNAIGESASYTDARLATELAPILGNLATAETSPASASHAVGEYLLYNKRLYKVLAAISAGQQLTIGTNIGQTNVAAELASQASMITVINSRMSDTAGFHNGIYRGKNITSYLTDGTLWNRIKGTGGYALFADLYLGDYITVGSNSYAIVDFDYYLRCGSVDLNEHHIVMMPTGNMNIPEGTALYGISGQTLQFINTANAGVTVSSQESATGFKWNAKMSDPNTHNTNGGYKYSRMRQVIMKAANTIVINAFGSSHVKPITVLYPNPSSETASGIASGWAWFANDDQSAADAKSLCDLPNETQTYGQQVWGRGTVYANMGYEVGTDKFQFAICALQRNFVDTRAHWWLRSVYSASYAVRVGIYGTADNSGAAYAFGVRPRFLLVG